MRDGRTDTHTHNRLTAFGLGQPGWAGTRRNTHPLTPILIIGHPLSSSSIYKDQWHPLCSFYVLDSPLVQPLSRSSLVFLLVLDPQFHTPYISSPNHHLLFAAHAHTNAACSGAIPMQCHLYLVSLLSILLGSLSFSLTPHIHLTILISARWCHHVFFRYRPGITSMQHAASHTTTVQPSSHNQTHVLIGKQWY